MSSKMNRNDVLEILRSHKGVLKERFGVKELSLVGSMARDEAGNDSDIDLMVKFVGPATAEYFFGAQSYLEEVFDRGIDLMTEKGLREGLHPYVKGDSIRV